MSGQKLLGIPISVQHTQAEKNRIANAPPAPPPKNHVGPMRLYVGSLHFNINEDMLRGIFEPFGKIDVIQLIMDSETGRSKGYGFITVSRFDKCSNFMSSTQFSICLTLSLAVSQCGRRKKGTRATERI